MIVSGDKLYKTKNGLDVVIYAIYKDQTCTIHGAIFENKQWRPASWRLNGAYSVVTSEYDLIEVKPRIKRTYWINLYPNNRAGFYYSRESADAFKSDGRLACQEIHIDCEEGEGL